MLWSSNRFVSLSRRVRCAPVFLREMSRPCGFEFGASFALVSTSLRQIPWAQSCLLHHFDAFPKVERRATRIPENKRCQLLETTTEQTVLPNVLSGPTLQAGLYYEYCNETLPHTRVRSGRSSNATAPAASPPPPPPSAWASNSFEWTARPG